jgi:hypothetical protein
MPASFVLPITAVVGLAVGLYDFLRRMGLSRRGLLLSNPRIEARERRCCAFGLFARAPDAACAKAALWKAGISCEKGYVTLLLLRSLWQAVQKSAARDLLRGEP